MERDPHLPMDGQPQAVVFQTEDGWIRAVPVGPGFRFDELDDRDRVRLLSVAAGRSEDEAR